MWKSCMNLFPYTYAWQQQKLNKTKKKNKKVGRKRRVNTERNTVKNKSQWLKCSTV